MNVIELLQHPEITGLVQKQEEVNRQKAKAGYNLFTISSYTSHLENFHSDVIASLLDPDGLHGEGYKFLYLFIEFLNRSHGVPVKPEDFANSIVLRETGRIDIWINDEANRQSIIIENKINNATDRDNQLKDYFEYAGDYPVKAIVYLSKDGRKEAPDNSVSVNSLVKNIAAFNNSAIDLYNGWLLPCLRESHTEDSRSVVYQYAKLIAHLGNKDMENEIKELFYNFVSKTDRIATLKTINNLFIDLPNYRADIFVKKIKSGTINNLFLSEGYLYKNYYVFRDFSFHNNSYNLDVCFESNGNAYVKVSNAKMPNEEGLKTVRAFLERAGLLPRLNEESENQAIISRFSISQRFPSLEEVDTAVFELVNEVFHKLAILSQEPK